MQQDNTAIIKQNLKQHHLFSKLTDLQLERACQFSQLQQLDEGQMLFSQADKVTSFYMVLSGKIKLFRVSPDGQEKILEIVKPGIVFAEALMFTNKADYPVSSEALSKTTVISIDAKNFHDMLWDSTATCLLLLGDMSIRLRKMVNDINTLTLQSGSCRVASYLLHEMPEHSNDFKLDTAKKNIAASLSVKPETFSRIIKNMSDQGILTISGSNVSIHDVDALKQKSIG